MVIKKIIEIFNVLSNRQETEIAPRNEREGGKKKFNWYLYLTAFVVNLASIASGAAFAWTSPVIPILKTPLTHAENPLSKELTVEEESWIASFLPIGALFGAVFAGAYYTSIGKKRTLLITIIPIIISDALLAYANTIEIFYIGRFLAGTTVGAVATVIPIYLCEIAEITNRGTLGCMFSTFLSFGNMYSYAVGPCLTLKTFTLSTMWASLGFFVIFPFFPETPSYYLADNDISKASKVLAMFRTKYFEDEFIQISAQVSHNEGDRTWKCFGERGFRRGMLICLSLIAFQQLSGISVVIFYMQSIFDSTATSISSYFCTVAVAVVQSIFCMLAVVIVDKLGRKVLLIISATGTALALILLGTYFYLQTTDVNIESFKWLPIGSILLHMAAYNIGFGPVPFAIIGEIFPNTPIASTITVLTCLSLTFFTTKFFPDLAVIIGQHSSFWLLGAIMLGAIVFIVKVVPETKGKSLKEIIVILEQ